MKKFFESIRNKFGNKIKKRSSSEGFALVPFISFGMMVAFFL